MSNSQSYTLKIYLAKYILKYFVSCLKKMFNSDYFLYCFCIINPHVIFTEQPQREKHEYSFILNQPKLFWVPLLIGYGTFTLQFELHCSSYSDSLSDLNPNILRFSKIFTFLSSFYIPLSIRIYFSKTLFEYF